MLAVAFALFASLAQQRCGEPKIERITTEPMFLDRALIFDACGLASSHNRLVVDDEINGACTFDRRLNLATCTFDRRPEGGEHRIAVQAPNGQRSDRISILFARERAWSDKRFVPFLCLSLVAIYFALWAMYMSERPLVGWSIAFVGMYLSASVDLSLQLDALRLADLAIRGPIFIGLGLIAHAISPEPDAPEPRWWRPLNALATVSFVGLTALWQGSMVGFVPAPAVAPSMLALYALALVARHVHRFGRSLQWSRESRVEGRELRGGGARSPREIRL